MKKFLFLFLTLTLMLSFSACENSSDSENSDSAPIVDKALEANSQEEESPDTTETEQSESATTATDNVEWKEFLAEYEAWVDEYIDFMDKYKENPSDASLLTEYSQLMTDMAEWSEKADEVTADLENASSSELVEYTAELSRILNKLTAAMQ